MGKAVQCPACGCKHRVSALPDAPTFRCEGCGKSLKVPAQFRPSVMASPAHIQWREPARQSESTAVLPGPAAAAAPAAPSAPARPRAPAPARPRVAAAGETGPRPVPLPLRLLAWAAALLLGLVVTVWIARVSGWLSGDRLVDVFTGTGGMARYLRVLALAPAWAVFTTGFLTLFFEGGRALAQRRNAVRADPNRSRRLGRRAERGSVDRPAGDRGGERVGGDGQGSRRRAARRGGR